MFFKKIEEKGEKKRVGIKMKKNILIIDDSALMRRVISDIINSDERLQVSGLAVNGLMGLDELASHPGKYDAIILDINMPKMNGLEFLEYLNRNHKKETVVVVSTLAKEGAKETIRALELGAFDFVTKPDSFIDAKSDDFKNRLLKCLSIAVKLEQPQLSSAIKNVSGRTAGKGIVSSTKRIPLASSVSGASAKKLVALACSTGGPKALQEVIPYLPENLDAPMLVVQHMPQGFTNSLAVRLNELSKIKVKEAADGEVIEKGTVYIAKGGSQMRLRRMPDGRHKLTVTVEPARKGLRPCADIMYESLTDCGYNDITCVVLTGMGADGTSGITQLNQSKHIYVIAQDEATSTVYGMPKMIVESGLADKVVPIRQVSEAIIKNVGVR